MGSPQTSEPEREQSDRKRARITELGSIVALATSFLALSLSAYQARLMNEQTRLMQNQSRASVWPYVAIGYSINDEGESRGYTWQISNDGVGPARIESVTMTLDGKPVRHWRELFRALFGDADVPATFERDPCRDLFPGCAAIDRFEDSGAWSIRGRVNKPRWTAHVPECRVNCF